MNSAKTSVALFKTARATLGSSPNPVLMDELDRLNITAAMGDDATALLLVIMRCYTSEQWWELADVVSDEDVQNTCHIWAVLAACYPDSVLAPEDALAAEHELVMNLANSAKNNDNPSVAVGVAQILRDALGMPEVSGPKEALSIATQLALSRVGDTLVSEGVLTQDELIDLEIEAVVSDGDLDGDVIGAAQPKVVSADDVEISANTVEVKPSTPLDYNELEAHRYIYQCAHSRLSEIIAAYTFNPTSALRDYADDFRELSRDFSSSEPVLITVLSTLTPPQDILHEIIGCTDPASRAHTSLCAALRITFLRDYIHAFNEEGVACNFVSEKEEEQYDKDFQRIAEVEKANTSDNSGGLCSLFDHTMIAAVLMQLNTTDYNDPEEQEKATALSSALINPFNPTKCSRLALWEELSSLESLNEPDSMINKSLELCTQIIAQGDDEIAREFGILDDEDEPEDGFA